MQRALLFEAARRLLALIEGKYHYETMDVKRWIADPDACEACQDNEDRGWILDDEGYDSPQFGIVDGPPAHYHCICELEYGEKRRRVYD